MPSGNENRRSNLSYPGRDHSDKERANPKGRYIVCCPLKSAAEAFVVPSRIYWV